MLKRSPAVHVRSRSASQNLGTTCYMNSLVQVLFATLPFRMAILAEAGTPTSAVLESTRTAADDVPDPLEALKAVFTRLQRGRAPAVDPSALMRALGLPPGEQQDVGEFARLLLQLLEQRLQTTTTVVRDLFTGHGTFVTTCAQCGQQRRLPNEVTELVLNVQDVDTLEDALRRYLAVEHLTGADRYLCERCEAKQDATRQLELDALPPVLMVQLARFVFDPVKLEKRKLARPISFPDRLVARTVIAPAGAAPSVTAARVLTAVVCHVGTSAYGGHYVTYVRSPSASGPYGRGLRLRCFTARRARADVRYAPMGGWGWRPFPARFHRTAARVAQRRAVVQVGRRRGHLDWRYLGFRKGKAASQRSCGRRRRGRAKRRSQRRRCDARPGVRGPRRRSRGRHRRGLGAGALVRRTARARDVREPALRAS